tara:strand:+ start:550 stop:711 length:162 start_codon:yes stop_codon:yes gene_type:complete
MSTVYFQYTAGQLDTNDQGEKDDEYDIIYKICNLQEEWTLKKTELWEDLNPNK